MSVGNNNEISRGCYGRDVDYDKPRIKQLSELLEFAKRRKIKTKYLVTYRNLKSKLRNNVMTERLHFRKESKWLKITIESVASSPSEASSEMLFEFLNFMMRQYRRNLIANNTKEREEKEKKWIEKFMENNDKKIK